MQPARRCSRWQLSPQMSQAPTTGSTRTVLVPRRQVPMARAATLTALPALLLLACLGGCNKAEAAYQRALGLQASRPVLAAGAACCATGCPLAINAQHSAAPDLRNPAPDLLEHAGGAQAACKADPDSGYGDGNSGCKNCTADGSRCEVCWEDFGLTKSGECVKCLPKLKEGGTLPTVVCTSCDGDVPDICTA